MVAPLLTSLALLAELRAGRYVLELRTRRQESAVWGGAHVIGGLVDKTATA